MNAFKSDTDIFVDFLKRLMERSNTTIDRIYEEIIYHFTITDRLCFDSKLDLNKYVIEFIELYQLEQYIKESK